MILREHQAAARLVIILHPTECFDVEIKYIDSNTHNIMFNHSNSYKFALDNMMLESMMEDVIKFADCVEKYFIAPHTISEIKDMSAERDNPIICCAGDCVEFHIDIGMARISISFPTKSNGVAKQDTKLIWTPGGYYYIAVGFRSHIDNRICTKMHLDGIVSTLRQFAGELLGRIGAYRG
jgi:hypothetical protein